MAEQVSTPGSAADSSNTGSAPAQSTSNKTPSGNPSAPKDKTCPFCGQPFTSSSLGRHLDLYIKEKNPKPADGLHDVDEIRKMRGAITRRQPRGGGRREGSQGTPGGTPGISRRDSGMMGDDETRSPSVVSRSQPVFDKGKTTTVLNQGSWQSTGVINNIPLMHQRNELNGMGGNAQGGEGGQVMETPPGHGKRTVSRQMLAKSTFDSKQKVIEAIEGQRAAELALRELLGSIKAAMYVSTNHSLVISSILTVRQNSSTTTSRNKPIRLRSAIS